MGFSGSTCLHSEDETRKGNQSFASTRCMYMTKCSVNTRDILWFICRVLSSTGLNDSFYPTKDKPYFALTSPNSSSVYVKVEQAALKLIRMFTQQFMLV